MNRGIEQDQGASASPIALAPPSGVKPASGLEQSRSSTGAEFMPAISMWQPYASLLFTWDRDRGEFAKAHETRSFKLPARLVGKRIAIHATAKFPPLRLISPELHELCYDLYGCSYNFSLPFGVIIGIVEFGAPVPTGEARPFQCEQEIAAGDWSPGRWAWPVMLAERLPAPVLMKGRQGWWRAPASVDTHPKDGDAVAAPLVSGAVPEGQTPNLPRKGASQ